MRFMLYVLVPFVIGCSETASADPKDNNPEIEILDKQATIQYKHIPGIENNLLSLDIYYNTDVANLKPIVLYVHGGAWSIGDKKNQVENKINLFQSLGYVFISINYRLSPVPADPGNSNRIKFPVHNVDVADAIKWVFENIGQYGGDNNKLALIGHSAGAHLVALTGTNNSFLENIGLKLASIKGVASIDTEGYNVPVKIKEGNRFYINAFGADSVANIEASPFYNLKSGFVYPKFFIAKRGSIKRLAIANEFIDALKKVGAEVWQVDGSVYDHSGINKAIGSPGETLITGALVEFLNECFK